ncbi:hypothetical protein EC973_005238 [Apophysomyces ossiformis]|uniref:Uncharacterized protein n=1 Tax=Apophysomyces ossiformis TaxID=679940 RepID=A0A8H7BVZ3_9FUNG|nr:hypothetical protein EC973_005238 [Apophysomyces ossiformis]
MQVDEPDKNEMRRMPRRQFRKQSKLKRRREKRQNAAKEREENTPSPSDEEIKQKAAKDLANQLEYSRQKELWEEREKRYTMINIARKKALQLEQEARAKAQKKWEEALRRIPMLPAEFEALKEDDSKTISLSGFHLRFIEEMSHPENYSTYAHLYIEQGE